MILWNLLESRIVPFGGLKTTLLTPTLSLYNPSDQYTFVARSLLMTIFLGQNIFGICWSKGQ